MLRQLQMYYYAISCDSLAVMSLGTPNLHCSQVVTGVKFRVSSWHCFGLMRKHVLTTRPTYLAAVLQDASKTYVAFLLLCTIV